MERRRRPRAAGQDGCRRAAGGSPRRLGHRDHGDRRDAEEAVSAPGLAGPAKKALATLDREWDGLVAHRDYPMIGLDNNAAGGMIRAPS